MTSLRKLIAIALIAPWPSVDAHTPALPRNMEVLSPNERHRVVVHPPPFDDRRAFDLILSENYQVLHEFFKPQEASDIIPWLELQTGPTANNPSISIWRRPLLDKISPGAVFVDDRGRILTIGTWPGGFSSDLLALALYDYDGRLIASYRMGDLFTKPLLSSMESSGVFSWWGNVTVEHRARQHDDEAPIPFPPGKSTTIYIDFSPAMKEVHAELNGIELTITSGVEPAIMTLR